MSEERSEKSALREVLRAAIPYVLRAVTPLHPGSGARISGIVDLAVQREAHTDLPAIYGSSLKGALRAWAEATRKFSKDEGENAKKVKEIFGPPPGRGSEGMGKAIFMDAKLLLMPVRTLKGTYGWVTSPFLINRFLEDLRLIQQLADLKKENAIPKALTGEPGSGKAWLQPNSPLVISVDGGKIVVIEDMKLDAEEEAGKFEFLNLLGGSLANRLEGRVAIIDHDVFKRILERALQISPHIAINKDKGTVQNLWFQEDLPPETILYSAIFTTDALRSDIEKLLQGVIHVGGDVTTGLGFAEVQRINMGGGSQ